jgi:hypothetical protein
MGCQGHIGSSEPASSSQRLKIPGRTRSLVARFSTHNDCARCEAVSYCPHARSGGSFATSRNPVQDRALPGPHQSSARPGRAHAMSLVTMTDLAIRTREPGGARPRSALVAGSDNQAQDAASAVHQTLGLIVAYIPSEILVTYVAVVAAIQSAPGAGHTGEWIAFWLFLALSPSICWVLYATKLRHRGNPMPLHPKLWPHWPMVAATISYAVWAYTLPATPFSSFSWYQAAVGTVVLLLVTMLLGLLAPMFQPSQS